MMASHPIEVIVAATAGKTKPRHSQFSLKKIEERERKMGRRKNKKGGRRIQLL